jgi:hypothetical protein
MSCIVPTTGAHQLAALGGGGRGAGGQLVGLARRVGTGLHGARELLHRRCRLLQAGGLLLGALAEVGLPAAISPLALSMWVAVLTSALLAPS